MKIRELIAETLDVRQVSVMTLEKIAEKRMRIKVAIQRLAFGRASCLVRFGKCDVPTVGAVTSR